MKDGEKPVLIKGNDSIYERRNVGADGRISGRIIDEQVHA